MSKRPSLLGRLTKFLVVPAALAATGFYVVAPRIGGKLAESPKLAGLREELVARAPDQRPQMQTMAGPPPSSSTPASGGPQVDVDVRRTISGPSVDIGAAEVPKPKKKRRRKKRTVVPAPNESAAATPAVTNSAPVEPSTPATAPPPVDPPADDRSGKTGDQGGSGGAATAGGDGFR